MNVTWKRAVIAGLAAGIIGVIVLVSGIVPIKASSGHWPITAWLLDFASDRSVATHSIGIEAPELNDADAIILGAATYESNCRFCHGQPGEGQPPVAQAMTPTPPLLSDSVPQMDAAELFYILKHGIKFAGMPAWPTQKRDDEIWPLVAFLKELPRMDNTAYRDLIKVESVEYLVESCAACHGEDGNGRAGERVPVLAGQYVAYLRDSLNAYRAGKRNSGIMMPIAHRLTDDEIGEISKYYASQNRLRTNLQALDGASIEHGRRLAYEGDQKAKIPSCVDCHGPGDILRSDDYPVLAGQPAWYLKQQLELFSKRDRGGSENASLMHPIADKLDDKSRRDLAFYYASLAKEKKQ